MRATEGPEFKALEDLLAVDLEYRLSVAVLSDCYFCPQYLIERRVVLIPEILKKAQETEDDAVEIFAKYVRLLHETHPPEMKR